MVTLSPASSSSVPLSAPPPHRLRALETRALPGESDADAADRVDTELMTIFRDTGSSDAFDELYRHSRRPVLDWLNWLLRARGLHLDSVELVQDTYVNVYRYAKSFRPDRAASFRCWVRTIASNCVRRAHSRRGRLQLVELREPSVEPLDQRALPHRRLVEREERRELGEAWVLFAAHYARAYAMLLPRDRRALALVEVDGLSYAETGRRLGVGSSNMKMIMLRARRRLCARMRESMEGARRSRLGLTG